MKNFSNNYFSSNYYYKNLDIYMFKFLINLLFLTQLQCLNISNINEYTRNGLIYKASKFSSLLLLQNSLNENEIKKNNIELDNKDAHNLENALYFYSPVDEQSSLLLEQRLLALNKHNMNLFEKYQIEKTPIHLHIQSFGGSLFHTLYLVDLIKNLETPVYTYIDGFAASAATLISTAGKKRFMTKNSLMLIHQLSSGGQGKYAELKDQGENLDMLMNFIVNHYLSNTKIKNNELMEILSRDIWLNSTNCLKYGLVDEIL